MRCLACGAEMRLLQMEPDETMMGTGYERYAFECPECCEGLQHVTTQMPTQPDIFSHLNRHCESCHHEIGLTDVFCRHCGADCADVPVESDAISVGSDPNKHIPETGVAVPQPSRFGFTKTSFRWLGHGLASVLLVIGVFVFAPVIERGLFRAPFSLPELKVEPYESGEGGGAIQITNIGKDAVEILDISINGRNECTMIGQIGTEEALRTSRDGKTDVDDFPVNAGQVWVMQRELTDEDRHKGWLQAGGISPSAKRKSQAASLLQKNANGKYDKCFYSCTDGPIVRCRMGALEKVCYKADISQAKLVIKAGDDRRWHTTCNIASSSVTTNRGTRTWEWK